MPVVDPDAGSGSGSGAVRRRLMRYVGMYSGSGSGAARPVYIGTPCGTTGHRRLMRFVGIWPAYGSGSGFVPARPVFERGECTTRGSGSGNYTGCCPSLKLPPRLYAKFTRLSGPCTTFDVGTVPLDYAAGTWTWQDPAVAYPRFVNFTCNDPGAPFETAWQIGFNQVGGCFFGLVAAGTAAATTCYDPFCVSWIVTYVQADFGAAGQDAECSPIGSTTVWCVTVFEPAAQNMCHCIPSGSGSGAYQVTRDSPRFNRGLGRAVAMKNGRMAYILGCCPAAPLGSGAGDGVDTECEAELVPTTLNVTITVAVGSCAGIDGQTLQIVYRGSGSWLGSLVVNGTTTFVQLICDSAGIWSIDVFASGCAWAGSVVFGGSGFPLVFPAMDTVGTNTCCGNGTQIVLTVTKP